MQLQRLTQFVEAHQNSTRVLELDDFFIKPFEKERRGAPRDVFPSDTFEDGLLQFIAMQASLRAGFQEVKAVTFVRQMVPLQDLARAGMIK